MCIIYTKHRFSQMQINEFHKTNLTTGKSAITETTAQQQCMLKQYNVGLLTALLLEMCTLPKTEQHKGYGYAVENNAHVNRMPTDN